MSQPRSVPHLDCCDKPMLVMVKGLYESSHDCESVERCETCGSHWFYRYHETVNYIDDSGDDWTVWHTRLNAHEALDLINATDCSDATDAARLAFLKDRPSIMKDRSGVKHVNGQPTNPWS